MLSAAQFVQATGISMTRVPYKGGAQAMPDLVAGRVQVGFGPVTAAGVRYVKDGQLRMLAILHARRSTAVPEVPTLAEAGIAGVSVLTWQSVFAPAGTSREIVARLAREIGLAVRDPDVRAQLERQSIEIEGSTPAALEATVREDLRAWALFVREAGLPKE